MTADMATLISSFAAFAVPTGWAWKIQQTVTEHTTILAERKESEDEWRRDLKDRLMRIEGKIDDRR